MGLVILVLTGFIGFSLLRSDVDPASAAAPSTPASTEPTIGLVASEEPTPEPTEPPDPTPEPTPAGPPAEVAAGGWATVTADELTVHPAAGSAESVSYRLVRGAVVHVAEGPTTVGEANWYRVGSLGGAAGWVSSGWIADPYLDTLVDDPTLIRCADVMRPVFDIVDGSPVPADPIRIGDLALPAAAFSDLSLGAIELSRGMDQEVCFSAQVGANGLPVVATELGVGACGHAVDEGGFFRLRPAVGENASLGSQVRDPVVVHPSVLVGGPPDDRKSSNLITLARLMTSEGVNGCINLNVVESADGDRTAYRSMNVALCSLVHVYNADSIKLTPMSGGPEAWIKLSSDGYQRGQFPLETPVMVSLGADAADGGRSAWAWSGGEEPCR